MKAMKRLLCMMLVITMVMSCTSIVMAADGSFSDVSNDQIYSNAVSTLNLMGVINGYPDGTFGPDKNVTRAEFTAMLMRTLNLGSVGSASAAGLPFTDIADDNSSINWAIPNINTAYGMKVINGYEDSTFRPNANVAFEEAVKMIVCTLGYGENVDVSANPWYANFITIANQIGITKNASKIGNVETPATRACIAQLLYDSLEVRLVKDGSRTDETILSSYLGYEKKTGIIASNGVTGIMSPNVSDKDNEVQIYTEDEGLYTYKTTDQNLKNYLGHEIEFYYTENDTHARILMLYVLHSSEPVVINAANVEKKKTNHGVIAYYEDLDDEDAKELEIESDNVVIYNGKLYGSNAENSRFDKGMLPTIGQIKLIDGNDNGEYDVIEITAYEVYYVSNKDTAKKGIIDNLIAPADKKTVSLDVDADKNLYIVDKDGKEVSYSSVSAGNIICLAKSRNDNGGTVITTAVVLDDKVTGTITASDGDGTVTIAGKKYSYSPAAPWMNGGTLEAPQVQDSGTYFLDLNGDIVAYNKNTVTENVKYGYILGYYELIESMDEEVEFRVLSTTGKTEYLGTYKNTTINGQTYPTGVAVANQLKKTATNGHTGKFAVQQLVKYTTKKNDGKDVFAKIITVSGIDQGQDIITDKLTALKSFYTDNEDPEEMSGPKTATYNSSSKTLTTVETGDASPTKVSLGNAVVISVPEDREDYDDFRKTAITTSLKNGISYQVEVFDLSKSNVPKVVVVYGADNSQAVNSLSPVCIVSSIGQEMNGDEDMYRAEVYKTTDSSASTVKEWISDESDAPEDLEPGDIFRAGVDKEGYAVVEDDYMIFDMDGTNAFGIKFDAKEEQAADEAGLELDIDEAEFVTIIGSVVARDEDTLLIADREFSEDDVKAQSYLTTDAMSFDIKQFEDAIVLIYDTEGDELELLSGNYEETIAGFTSYTDEVAPTKILIYMSEGEIKLLCVLPDEF